MSERILVALDIETVSITDNKEDALIPHKSRITCIGIWGHNGEIAKVYREPWTDFLEEIYYDSNICFVGQNFKFDLKHMHEHFGEMPGHTNRWEDDSRLMGFVYTEKVSEDYLAAYEERRKELNKELPSGINHREASLHSLKTMAPYFLNVEAFWENPADHNNDEYVLKDCEYTYRLVEYFYKNMPVEQIQFYKEKLMPWSKMILQAELEGVVIDLAKIEELESSNAKEIVQLTATLKELWKDHYEAYTQKAISELNTRYNEMFQSAASKHPNKSLVDLQLKYVNLFETAKRKLLDSGDAELNLDSPSQLKWLLQDRLGLDVTNLEGDESTGKEVLQRLAMENKDVDKLLRLRKITKLNTAFFPKYKELAINGRIHAEFNIDGTRTGRLSSSRPNLQQHSRDLKALFKASKGCKFITYDLQSIEPVLMAYFSEDESLVDIVTNNKNFHSINTKLVFDLDCTDEEVKDKHKNLRDIAKEICLALLYGAGWNQVRMSCMKRGIIKTESECKRVVKMIREKYKGVWQFKQALDQELEKGTIIYNMMGRPLKINNPEDVYMRGFNTLIQGSASDIVLDIAHEISTQLPATPLMFIHDSVVFEVLEEEAEELDKEIQKRFKRKLTTETFSYNLNIDGGINNVWD